MRSSNTFTALAGLVSLVAACGTSTADRARDVAVNRLHCPSDLVMTTESDRSPQMFIASGCGERTLCELVHGSKLSAERIGAGVAVRCVPLPAPGMASAN
jgi:hypothetical protein